MKAFIFSLILIASCGPVMAAAQSPTSTLKPKTPPAPAATDSASQSAQQTLQESEQALQQAGGDDENTDNSTAPVQKAQPEPADNSAK